MPDNTSNPIQIKRISERVWSLTETVYSDIELLANSGFYSGSSSIEIAETLKQYLKNPQSLTIEEIQALESSGKISSYQSSKLQESLYKPLPRGVYRSAIKNAFRLSRNETNIAYHNQDFVNRQKLPFVIGIKVELSGQHGARMPNGDMCDHLAGKYPRDFVFSGWHVQCLCHTVSILAKESDLKKFYRDEKVQFDYVQKMPKSSTNWIKDNKESIKKMKSKPYFIRDNKIKV